ncbi:hypothetical protein [Photobacterium indicum]|uniref:hypothetical protein n=1 Tax=Photobacterium indicum TaxID=81447 RepID=UPI003D109CD8
MALYKITYTLEEDVIHREDVFMMSLSAAKRSAAAQAKSAHIDIQIHDIGETLLSYRQSGKWLTPKP